MSRQLILVLALALTVLLPAARTPAAESASPAERHAAGHGHGAEAEAQPNILEPQPSLAIWTVVVFIGLLLVLGRFAWKPLLEALHQREVHLEHVLHDTERARNEAEGLLAEHRRLMADAQDKVRAMLEEARREAQGAADEIVKKAQGEAETARHRAERDIATARDQALVELWSKSAELAVSVAGRVLARDLGPDEHRRLIEAALTELPSGPVAGNGHARGGAPA
jgi:F-type H+-transporting ATPase subunit b